MSINVRYFLAVNAGLALFALALELIPCVIAQQHQQLSLKALFAVVSISGFSILGLLYAVRKGDMSWLSGEKSLSLSLLR